MRARGGDHGHIHFQMNALMKNPDSLADKLRRGTRSRRLVPASPWLGAAPPAKPAVSLGRDAATDEYSLKLAPAKDEACGSGRFARTPAASGRRRFFPGRSERTGCPRIASSACTSPP